MSKAKPLTAEQCEAAREAMLTGHSLSKISRCAGVVATIEYMLKDIRLLETYLQRMASAITQKREQISHAYALEHEHQYGKTEMWYVMEAAPDAYLYYGLKKSVTKGELSKSITDGTIIDLLRAVPVHAGDLFFIPAGTMRN